MPTTLQLKFDPNQPHQLVAIESTVRLFEGFPRVPDAELLQADIVPNLPPYEELNEDGIFDNLRHIQEENDIPRDTLLPELQMDEGTVLEWAGAESWRYPNFTIEMETGTGKTYVYLRTIYELRKRYGFSKFIIIVPSIAIYEGVIKNFQITKPHFSALYDNETVHLIPYEGSRISQLRSFAASTAVEILVMTIDSFNKKSNVIFKPSEKLPGERLPIEYIQETRPILILDEPQNMESPKSKEALRTLHPLFALRYSATHRTSPNLVYRLTPFDAYRLNLVKKIQVIGVTERENFNEPYIHLESIEIGQRIKARICTYILEKGRLKDATITLYKGDDLFTKTHREEHRNGFKVDEINLADGYLLFENGVRLTRGEYIGPTKQDIFRIQIRETLRQHMEMQERLQKKDIKVLSLFFIDRVANYTDPDHGFIRQIFDEEFERMKQHYPFYEQMHAEEVRNAYFAIKKTKKGEEFIDTRGGKTKEERAAEKAAFQLIMKDKERLLSFDEKTCFIFAHSALREGWDNPNVFQICTLNQTVSEMKKRQEIGRGLRIAVNQNGERVFDEDVNILTVVANESYESYAATLQSEYEAENLIAPPKPTKAGKAKAYRRDAIFTSNPFRRFWKKLQKRITYEITLDPDQLIQDSIDRINNRRLPDTLMVVERGQFIMATYSIKALSVGADKCKIEFDYRDTQGDTSHQVKTLRLHDDLEKAFSDPNLKNYKIVEIHSDPPPFITFANGKQLHEGEVINFQTRSSKRPREHVALAHKDLYPLRFNLLDRAARETGLTRPTLNRIFKGLSDRKKEEVFKNPEGFAGLFISEINNALADHVAERIQFQVEADPAHWGYDLDDLFPPEKEFPQKELVPGADPSLYDKVQIDSDVEKNFVELRLNSDDQLVFYFKFPPAFKFDFPRVIGNYNPDWGICRYDPKTDKYCIELVRETKGTTELDKLQFPHEKRKIICAIKLFKSLGIDYRVVTDETPDWWRSVDVRQEWKLF